MYPLSWLAVAVKPADLVAARSQMALSLGWHIIIACFGVAIPRRGLPAARFEMGVLWLGLIAIAHR
jgi:hypothetical protein